MLPVHKVSKIPNNCLHRASFHTVLGMLILLGAAAVIVVLLVLVLRKSRGSEEVCVAVFVSSCHARLGQRNGSRLRGLKGRVGVINNCNNCRERP